MAQDVSSDGDRLPAETRDLAMRLREDLARLRLKWSYYRALFDGLENARLLSDTARAFFQMVEESFRHDMIVSLCRLSDPARTPDRDHASLATLVAQCEGIPRLEHLLTALQAACGPVRRYRHRHLEHNDPDALIVPRQELVPDVDRPQIDEILQLGEGILQAVFSREPAADPGFQPAHAGSASDLIQWLSIARRIRRDPGA
jgi:hypothetical protein